MSTPWTDIAVGTITGGASWAAWRYAVKKDRQALATSNARSASEFGQTMATTAFDSLKAQVDDFITQQKIWAEERRDFLDRADKLSEQLLALQAQITLTNSYVHQLLLVLDQNNIVRPPSPIGLTIVRDKPE